MSEVCRCGHAKVWHEFYETNLSLACTDKRCDCIDYQRDERPGRVASPSGCTCPPGSPLHFAPAPCIAQQRDERPAKDGA